MTTENPAPPPVAPALYGQSRTTPKDFFLWLGAVITLYASLGALTTLLFEYINYTYPDPLAFYSDPYGGLMRAAMATVLVMVPTCVLLLHIIRNQSEDDPSKLHTWVRKWALVLTIFIASALVVIDLITLITTFLGGEITVRFILKAAVVLLTGVGISLHFLADIQGYWVTQHRKATAIGVSFAIMALIIVVSGFFIVGTPAAARLTRFDEQKVQDLQNIQYQLTDYYQRKRTVPQTLDLLNDPLSSYAVPIDTQRNTDYEYGPQSSTSFILCATFNKPSLDTDIRNSYPGGSNYYGIDQSFVHEAGRQCFTRTIDPARYPAVPQTK